MTDTIFKQIQKSIIVKEYSLKQLQEINSSPDCPKEQEWLDYPYLEDIKSLYIGNRENSQKYKRIISMQVSNFGNIKITRYKDNGYNEIETVDTSNNTLKIDDDIEKNYYRLPEYPGFDNIYRLVADTWLEGGKRGMVVHHIDNNGRNNYVTNLIWVTKEEHYLIHRK